jgi:O-antigen/teichoic acid export membrane protein
LALQYFVQVLDTYESYNQASGKLVSTARARMVALAIGSAARLAAIWADAGVIVFAWLVVAQLAINLGWIAFGARALPDVRGGSFDRTQARRLLSMGAMLAIASGLNVLQARVEILLLERLLGLDAVGVYSAALRLVEVVDSVGVVAVTVYLPRLLGAASAGRLDDEHLVRSYRLAFVLYLACVPALAGLALIGWLFLSGRFPDVHWLVLALAPRPLLAFLGLTRSMHMLADEQLRYGVACALAGLVVGTALAMATIPVFGIPGAVLSGLASFVVSNVLIDAFFNRRYFRALARSLGMA